MYGDWKVKIIDKGFTFTRDVFIFRLVSNGKREIMRGNTFEVIDEGVHVTEPSMTLEPEVLQAFSNALNEQGFKPQDGFIEGKLLATEKHLEDMRSIVFDKEDK